MQAVAYGPEHAASALRLRPEVVKLLAGVTDVPGASALWDKATRAMSPQVAYHQNSSAECSLLLSSVIELGRDTAQSGRDMYLVEALARYQPQCQELGGCVEATGYLVGQPSA